jgi:hypothetical protein
MFSFQGIKNFLNWPKAGVKNLTDLKNYLSANWLSLLVLVIIALIIWWIVKKVLSFVFGMFRD